MKFQNPIVTPELLDRVTEGVPGRLSGIHGLPHWIRVERNGLYLAESERADTDVVSLFALFHDARRYTDGADPGHGARGAELSKTIYREGMLPIDGEQLETLAFACEYHTDQDYADDVTAGCCWDADRLDLPRIGVVTDPSMLNTNPAKAIAGSGDYSRLEDFRYAGVAS